MTISQAARTRLERLARTTSFGAQRNCRTLSSINAASTVITMTTQGNIGFSGPTEDYEAAVNGSPYNTINPKHPFKFSGGYQHMNNGIGEITFPSLREGAMVSGTYSNVVGGNIDNTGVAARTWRAHFMTDADKVALFVRGGNTPYRFLVDGQFVDTAPFNSNSGGGRQFITLDFGSRRALGRKVTLEGNSAAGFSGCYVPKGCSVWPIDTGDLIKVGIVGDSFSTGTGATLNNDAFPVVLGDYLGADDIWSMGIGGTGYSNANAYVNYGGHEYDWIDANGGTNLSATGNVAGWDAPIFTGGNNDSDSTNQPNVQSNATMLLEHARAAIPDVPFFIFGPSTSPTTYNLLVETSLKAAVASLVDPLMVFIPTQNPDVGSPEIFGTGHVGATTGDGPADFYIGTDGTHPPTEGHLYIGHRRALQVRKALLDMLL